MGARKSSTTDRGIKQQARLQPLRVLSNAKLPPPPLVTKRAQGFEVIQSPLLRDLYRAPGRRRAAGLSVVEECIGYHPVYFLFRSLSYLRQ